MKKKDALIYIRSDKVEPFLQKLANAVRLAEAVEYANMARMQSLSLAQSGILPAIVPFDATGLKEGSFSIIDIDQFMNRLSDGATVLSPSDVGFYQLGTAAKKACCSVIEVVNFIRNQP